MDCAQVYLVLVNVYNFAIRELWFLGTILEKLELVSTETHDHKKREREESHWQKNLLEVSGSCPKSHINIQVKTLYFLSLPEAVFFNY